MVIWRENIWELVLKWRMNSFEWENRLQQFQYVLTNVHERRFVTDTWRWKACPSDLYTTYLAYKHDENGPIEVFSRIWNIKIPNKVSLVIWRSLLNKLPTKDNMLRHNIMSKSFDLFCMFCH
ncbi:hypothetical protein GmHk_10G028300 [Glycine max]|nr:hypothetical protein GmHk_10G028300 [Glycine max]